MLRLFRRHRAPSEAARTLGKRGILARAKQANTDRQKVRETANRIRADLRAKGIANLPDIDWREFP